MTRQPYERMDPADVSVLVEDMTDVEKIIYASVFARSYHKGMHHYDARPRRSAVANPTEYGEKTREFEEGVVHSSIEEASAAVFYHRECVPIKPKENHENCKA